MKPNLILLLQLLPVIRKVSGSSYVNKTTTAQRTQNASLQHSCFMIRYHSDAFKVRWDF